MTDIEIVPESFESLEEIYKSSGLDLKWDLVFTLPYWINVWWKTFGNSKKPFVFSVRRGEGMAGIAPLQIRDQVASFIGSADICDYLDFIVSPKQCEDFFNGVLDHLEKNNVRLLDLRCLRPDSPTQMVMIPLAKKRGYQVICEPDGVSLETELTGSWDDYLMQLKSKQRHEVRRKIRRLYEAGDVRFDVYEQAKDISKRLDLFFTLFKESREDKTEFMTSQMESFFLNMVSAMVGCGVLKLGVMSLDNDPVAAVLYFDYNNSIYLYNNGYDIKFGSLSVGVLSKVMLIQHGIHQKKDKFDFLKGTETYKYRLGGKEVLLNRLQITLT